MWSYTYKHGDRPLDGYTVQRAAGRGGFGEVYYAVSDAGREVALKSITGFEQIELRGIGQCMNLKSPHLVTIFDVKQNAEGRWFVLMEYVNGPNLRELLDESPAGLGPQKAAFFLREIAKGLSYLHDCGIVHRDLKPANIFFENGYVKIGDYGLSKAIEPTHHSGQTVTVGTVHYMAPEVGVGRYDRSIDIYALGALLYEMMTGMVPFVGASASEILIKHLSAEADCSGIPEPFCTAIKKAMAKDPAQRFQTVQEMVESVFGAEHVRNSVSQFSPTDLSMVAGRIAARIAPVPAGLPGSAGARVGGLGASPPPSSSVTSPTGLGAPPLPTPPPLPRQRPEPADPGGAWAAGWVAGQAIRGGQRVGKAILGPAPHASDVPLEPKPDTISLRQRIFLSALATVVVSSAAILFAHSRNEEQIWLHTAFAIAGASTAIYLFARRWLPRPIPGTGWADRFAMAACGTLGGITLSAPVWLGSYEARDNRALFVAMVAALAIANPRRWTNADRIARINFGSAIAAGFIAFIATAIFGGNPVLAIAIVGGAALVVQVLAPWDEQAAAARAERGETDDDDDEDEEERRQKPGPAANGNESYGQPRPVWLGGAAAAAGTIPYATPRRSYTGERPVPRGLLIGWFFGTIGFLSVGLLLSVIAGVGTNSWNEFSEFWAGAMVMYSLAAFCFMRMRRRTYTSWLTYLVVPAFRCACVAVVLACWAMLGLGQHGGSDEECFAVAMVVFLMLWGLSWMGPWLWRAAIPPAPPPLPLTSPAWPPRPAPASRPAQAQEANVAAARTADARTADAGTADAGTAAPVDPAAATAVPSPRHRSIRPPKRPRHERDIVGGFTGVTGGLLLFVALLLFAALAVDVPAMIAAGVPSPTFSRRFIDDVFGPNARDWPTLMRVVMSLAALVLLALGLGGMIVGRRKAGGWHMVRGVAGVMAVFGMLQALRSRFERVEPWPEVSGKIRAGLPGGALEELLAAVSKPQVVATLLVLVVAAVLIAWPRRPRVSQSPPDESPAGVPS